MSRCLSQTVTFELQIEGSPWKSPANNKRARQKQQRTCGVWERSELVRGTHRSDVGEKVMNGWQGRTNGEIRQVGKDRRQCSLKVR